MQHHGFPCRWLVLGVYLEHRLVQCRTSGVSQNVLNLHRKHSADQPPFVAQSEVPADMTLEPRTPPDKPCVNWLIRWQFLADHPPQDIKTIVDLKPLGLEPLRTAVTPVVCGRGRMAPVIHAQS